MSLAVGGHTAPFFGSHVEAEAGSLCSWWRGGGEVAEQVAAWAPAVFDKRVRQGFLRNQIRTVIAERDCHRQRRVSSG